VIAANPRAVADYRAGKPVAGFFVGQVMKATGGAADASRVTTLVRERLDAGD
jgi:aspartyl-tRNA(Asn)/glutamyl-tRNA(Gln) amidotransferase subunit B